MSSTVCLYIFFINSILTQTPIGKFFYPSAPIFVWNNLRVNRLFIASVYSQIFCLKPSQILQTTRYKFYMFSIWKIYQLINVVWRFHYLSSINILKSTFHLPKNMFFIQFNGRSLKTMENALYFVLNGLFFPEIF